MKDKPIKKKIAPWKTTSKKTGAIILVTFILLLALTISFLIYAYDFAQKQKLYEDEFRLLPCEDMKLDYQKDPYIWKIITLKDMNCITSQEYHNELSKWTK